MRHRWDVYRGRRAGNGSLPSILLTLAMLLVIAFVAVFFALPSHLVYTRDSVSLEIPGFTAENAETGEEALVEDPAATPEPDYSSVAAEIVVRAPDYSSLTLANGEGLDILQSVYVPYEQVNADGLTAAIAKCRELEVKAITMELRDETGMLLWNSSTDMAVNYLLNGTLDLKGTVEDLKSQGYYLTAQISACVDATLSSRNGPIALKAAGGFPYSDTTGAWLDPWNADVRQYTIDLCAELMSLGFNEVVLQHAAHPTNQVEYTRSMSGELTRVACVTNFCIAVREGLEEVMAETGARLSVMMDAAALNNDTYDNGQDLGYLLRIFDRVYTFTETYQEANQVIALGIDSTERFVPIISWTFPGGSWAQNLFEVGME